MNFVFRGVILIFLTVALIGCKERDNILGENYLDSQLEVRYDTIDNVTTKSVLYSDIIRSGVWFSLIGDYHDEIFGDHKASTAISFVPQSESPDIGDNPVADSLVLQLQYTGIYYGFDTINPQTIKAYRLIQDIGDIDSTDMSNYEQNGIAEYYDPTPIGQATYRPSTDSASEYLRIKLNNNIANEFMTNMETGLNDETFNDETFKEFFKGIYLESDRTSGDGAIMSFITDVATSHIKLYFHNDEDTALTFLHNPFNSEDAEIQTHRYNFFDHDYSSGEINNYSAGDNEFAVDDSLVFAQSMRGINMNIDVNMSDSDIFSDELSNENIVINRVLLQLQTTRRDGPNDSTEYAPPANFVLLELLDQEETQTIIDYFIPEYGRSSPVPYNSEDKTYEIILSGFTHEKLQNGQKEYSLKFQPSSISTTANRGVFFGSNAADYNKRPKVIITYSLGTNN